MSTPTPTRRPWPLTAWFTAAGLLALAAIGILWALPRPAQVVCPAIYPVPPECTDLAPAAVLPFLVLIVLLTAAIVACGLLVPVARRALVLGILVGGVGVVFLVGLATALSAASPGYSF